MPLLITVEFVCDKCKKRAVINESPADFYHDYLYSPEDVKGWTDSISLLPWPHKYDEPGMNENDFLYCPECSRAYLESKKPKAITLEVQNLVIDANTLFNRSNKNG